MTNQRAMSSFLMVTIFLVSYFYLEPIFFHVLILIVGGILFFELSSLLKLKGLGLAVYWFFSVYPLIFFLGLECFSPYAVSSYCGEDITLNETPLWFQLLFGNWPGNSKYAVANMIMLSSLIASMIFWFFLAPILIYTKKSLHHFLTPFYGFFLITPLIISIGHIYNWDKGYGTDNHFSLLIIIMTIAVADISAYFVGKKFGVTKLAKNISPGKTIEGMFGGFVGVVLFAFIIDSFWQSPFVFADSRLRDFGLLFSVMLALIIAVLSVYGDIFESFLKRKANVKDSGNIIPGHGGLLDRMDGYLATFPILVLMFDIYVSHIMFGNVAIHFYSELIEGFEAFGHYLALVLNPIT